MPLTKEQQLLLDLYDSLNDMDEVHRHVNEHLADQYDETSRSAIRKQLRDLIQQRKEESPPVKKLFLDIETAPMEALVWSMWKNNVTKDQLMEDWYMLTWAGAWEHEPDDIFGKGLQDYEGAIDTKDDKPLLEDLWELMEEADVIVAHNGQRFDVPKINTRLLIHGIIPPSPFQVIDTLKVLKRKFRFSSNRLDFVSKRLGYGGKDEHEGMLMWQKCVRGDRQAFADMLSYNMGDIRELMLVHDRLKAWMVSGPNVAMIEQKGHRACTHCGSENLTEGRTPYRTTAGEYRTWRCGDCGAISRERTTSVSQDVRQNLLRPLGR